MGPENQSTFAMLFDEMSDGLCVSNGHGDVLYMNPAAERLLGMPTTTETRERNFCELLCGHIATPASKECMSSCPLRDKRSDARATTISGQYNRRQGYTWENDRISRFQKWKDLRVRCLQMPTALFDSWATEKHFTLIEDISAEKELERSKEAWHAMVDHDLRTPLTNMMAVLGGLREVPGDRPLQEKERSLIEAGLRAGGRMVGLLNDLLDLARLDAGRMPVQLQAVDAAELTAQCVAEQSPTALSKGIQVRMDLHPSFKAVADPHLFQRVVQNLLGNAIKFTPPEGSVTITGSTLLNHARLCFKDTGIGIEEKDIPSIFDRYRQARPGELNVVRGSGLGLAFCREALRAMEGTIQVESRLGKGAEFTVRLPAA